MMTTFYANIMLVLVTIAWGLTFPVIKTVAQDIDPALFVSSRFLLACILLIPFLKIKSLFNKQLMIAGFILGTLNCGVYLLQTLALENLSASRCAFLTGTVVIWVPIFSYFFLKLKISKYYITAAVTCLIGLWIMTGADLRGVSLADGEMLLAEACFGLSLLYIDKIGPQCSCLFTLTFYQIMFTCPIPLLFSFLHGASWHPLLDTKVIQAVLFCALFATVIVLLIQLKFQPRVKSLHASLIYSLEPFWAAVFSSSFFGEVLTMPLIVGGGIMMFSVLLPEVLKHSNLALDNR